jgi:hypothetical protein
MGVLLRSSFPQFLQLLSASFRSQASRRALLAISNNTQYGTPAVKNEETPLLLNAL